MALIEVKNAVKIYEDKNSVPVKALDGLSLTIAAGEFTAIVGPSGSGKTTLLNAIGGLDTLSSGQTLIDGQDIAALSANALAEFRLRNIGFIFQAYNLIPVLSAAENVDFILLLQGIDKAERHKRVAAELAELGIDAAMMDRRPHELSGGQQQRVAVARATVARPRIILADEPTANLDSKTGAHLLDKMREMNEKKGITFVFSTHDQMVMEHARRLVILRDGQIVEEKIQR